MSCLSRKENPKIGVSRVAWSSDSSFIATKSDQMPHNVWIWHVETMRLHSVISLLQPVRNFRWDPTQLRLAVCSAEGRVHLWSPRGISWIDVLTGKLSILFLLLTAELQC